MSVLPTFAVPEADTLDSSTIPGTTTGPTAAESSSPNPPSARASMYLPNRPYLSTSSCVSVSVLPCASSILVSADADVLPQYHAHVTFSLSVTSPCAAVAVAVSVVPTFTLPDAPSFTDVTLMEPAAATGRLTVALYELLPTFAFTTQRRYLPCSEASIASSELVAFSMSA